MQTDLRGRDCIAPELNWTKDEIETLLDVAWDLKRKRAVGEPHALLRDKVLGLLFFFIPGVIAFAVDFINGTIYLPPDCVDCEPVSQAPGARPKRVALRKIPVSRDQLTPTGIERIIAKETGKKIALEDGDYITEKLEKIDDFWDVRSSYDGHIIKGAVS